MTVLTFMDQFHDHVRSGRKPHTIRPVRKRPIKGGDPLRLRGWSGRPYRSPQFALKNTTCAYVVPVEMYYLPDMSIEVIAGGWALDDAELEGLAMADGFDGTHTMTPWEVMDLWFRSNHAKSLEAGFRGILIGWDTPDWLDTMAAEGRDPRDTP